MVSPIKIVRYCGEEEGEMDTLMMVMEFFRCIGEIEACRANPLQRSDSRSRRETPTLDDWMVNSPIPSSGNVRL